MAKEKTVNLKPSRKGSKSLEDFARRAREIRDRFVAEGRSFSDSTKDIREDRESRR